MAGGKRVRTLTGGKRVRTLASNPCDVAKDLTLGHHRERQFLVACQDCRYVLLELSVGDAGDGLPALCLWLCEPSFTSARGERTWLVGSQVSALALPRLRAKELPAFACGSQFRRRSSGRGLRTTSGPATTSGTRQSRTQPPGRRRRRPSIGLSKRRRVVGFGKHTPRHVRERPPDTSAASPRDSLRL